jgi:hypothetical protein
VLLISILWPWTHRLNGSMVSGGADPSLRFWDLENRGSELDFLYKPIASIDRYIPCFVLILRGD